MEEEHKYLIGIIQVENFNSLVALFGYELHDDILGFVSKELISLQQRFGYETFQLSHNKFAILHKVKQRSLTLLIAYEYLLDLFARLGGKSLPWDQKEIRLQYRIGASLISYGERMKAMSNANLALQYGEKNHQNVTLYRAEKHDHKSELNTSFDFSLLVENIKKQRLKVHFQPIVDAMSLKIFWYECLTRVEDDQGNYLSIQPYLSIAKSTGFYEEITIYVLKTACQALLTSKRDISINVSLQDINNPNFIHAVLSEKKKIRQAAGTLIFEIMESENLSAVNQCSEFIQLIELLGCKVAIDGFGSGDCNLSKIQDSPVDIIKIDGSLISRLPFDEQAKTLVGDIGKYCRRFNKRTVAEFVENEKVYALVKEMQIDYAQGFYLGKPVRFADN